MARNQPDEQPACSDELAAEKRFLHPTEGSSVLLPNGPRTILKDGHEARFATGWRPVLAYTGLAPITIILFVSDTGGEGLWILDADFNYHASAVPQISNVVAAQIVVPLCPLLEGIWQATMLSESGNPACARRQAFLQLPEFCRGQLTSFYLDGFVAECRHNHIGQPSGMASRAPVIDCGGRRVPIRVGELHAMFDPSLLQRKQEMLIASGHFTLPSIFSDNVLTCCKAFYLDAHLTAYRLFDEQSQTTFFLLAGDILFRVLAVYIPEANLVLSHDPAGSSKRWPTLMADFFYHVVRYGDSIGTYLEAGDSRPMHFWRGAGALHLGHLLWNDLSGIDDLVTKFRPEKLPSFMLCDTEAGPEMYGLLDGLFPELCGKVERNRESFNALIGSFYDRNLCLFRSSRTKVTGSLRRRVLADVPQRGANAPIVLLGLRTENRTLADLDGFCRRVVTRLVALRTRIVLVVDGHNEGATGRPISSNQEHLAEHSPLEQEQRLVASIRDEAAGTLVEIVSLIGEPLRESLAWCRSAAFFVTFWGAGLAKYRWVCNTRGLVVTNAWNLDNLGDLQLYSNAETMESPSEMVFMPKAAITDLPDNPLLIRVFDRFEPSICNFTMDLDQFSTCLDRQIKVWLPALTPPPVKPSPAMRRAQGASRTIASAGFVG
ncbi:hypothetical protein [Lichenicoccus sp.]|uniref:hypothetical protein n=1 Tax=Lichenicoccus sp. TaxID=2781899 RepID=UPI003D111BA2